MLPAEGNTDMTDHDLPFVTITLSTSEALHAGIVLRNFVRDAPPDSVIDVDKVNDVYQTILHAEAAASFTVAKARVLTTRKEA